MKSVNRPDGLVSHPPHPFEASPAVWGIASVQLVLAPQDCHGAGNSSCRSILNITCPQADSSCCATWERYPGAPALVDGWSKTLLLVDAVPDPSTQSVIGGVVSCARVAWIWIPGVHDVLGGIDVAVTVHRGASRIVAGHARSEERRVGKEG